MNRQAYMYMVLVCEHRTDPRLCNESTCSPPMYRIPTMRIDNSLGVILHCICLVSSNCSEIECSYPNWVEVLHPSSNHKATSVRGYNQLAS